MEAGYRLDEIRDMTVIEWIEFSRRAAVRRARRPLELIHIIHSKEIKRLARQYASALQRAIRRIGRRGGGGIKLGALKALFGGRLPMRRVDRKDGRPARNA